MRRRGKVSETRKLVAILAKHDVHKRWYFLRIALGQRSSRTAPRRLVPTVNVSDR